MSLQIGIVGLPNVGKSTLFNALVKGAQAEAANYPFCTIDPNIGVVKVPDERLDKLAKISQSKQIIPATVEFVDIAGLVRGASKGEGLGNKFLAHIRECDAIAMVVRFFKDEKIIHSENRVDPYEDIITIETELQLADYATVEKRLGSLEKEIKAGSKDAPILKNALEKIKNKLDNGKNVREISLDEKELELVRDLSLMTMKPILYIANVSEGQLSQMDNGLSRQQTADSTDMTPVSCLSSFDLSSIDNYDFIPISAKIEAELNELDDFEKTEYLKELGMIQSGLDRLIQAAYKSLGLATYFTSGEKETRAWTIKENATAPEAAGVIHTDFQRGFIAAEIVNHQDFVDNNGWSGARAKGLVRTEGKTYHVKDGDVIVFRFNI
ncbi:MAG TPA: redox-regulated ATPase YchF [bacterium]|nr:redox-regulated ATPase YchF [bacterium]